MKKPSRRADQHLFAIVGALRAMPRKMTIPQLAMLLTVHGRKAITLSDLCANLNFSKSHVCQTMTLMEDRGLVQRSERDGDNRRQVTVTLLPGGRDAVSAMKKAARRTQRPA